MISDQFSPIIRYAEAADLPAIRRLALDIWPIAYSDILTTRQLEYMLEKMYSLQALSEQAADNIFLIAEMDGRASGFASYSSTENERLYKVHKLYVLPDSQGSGLGKQLLNMIVREVKIKGGDILQLNVNRRNKAKDFYTKQGFSIIREEDIDIGNGFFMNDYIMEKQLGSPDQVR